MNNLMNEVLRDEVLRDIQECESILQNNDVVSAEQKVKEIIASYENYIDNIHNELTLYNWGSTLSYLYDIKLLMKKLRLFLLTDCTPTKHYKKGEETKLNINTTNNNNNTNENTNTNEINMQLEFRQVREVIENMSSLPIEEIDEILKRIDEIEEISNSGEKPNRKWGKLKGCMGWLGTKGVDIGLKLMPLIIKAVESN